MSVEHTFGNFFKPEVKSSGRKLFAQEKISISSQSDTAVQAFVRVAPVFKVSLSSEDISSPSFTATCNCPAAKKDRFCKHIWATLLCVEESCPDFLSSKTEINKISAVSNTQQSKSDTHREAAKQKAAEYRKDQYQKQKARAKEKKQERKSAEKTHEYPAEVETALAYFSLNGFSMTAGFSKESLAEAKRTLSRVFHPDKGGSHQESVELNQHCDVLLRFFRD